MCESAKQSLLYNEESLDRQRWGLHYFRAGHCAVGSSFHFQNQCTHCGSTTQRVFAAVGALKDPAQTDCLGWLGAHCRFQYIQGAIWGHGPTVGVIQRVGRGRGRHGGVNDGSFLCEREIAIDFWGCAKSGNIL